jgi:dUTP pyrophosphatase
MTIKIKRFDADLPLPGYHTRGAAGFDLRARERVAIEPGAVGYVPLGIAMKIPDGHFILLAARSSLHKKGLMMANSVGIWDSDFSGDDDEIKAALFNFSKELAVIEKGDRIVQAVIMPFVRGEWCEVLKMDDETRGGFGSTGTN